MVFQGDFWTIGHFGGKRFSVFLKKYATLRPKLHHMNSFRLTSVLYLIALATLFSNCRVYNPKIPFDSKQIPPAPDYARQENWSALPDRRDSADVSVSPQLPERQAVAEADVFFLHPTSLVGDKKHSRNPAAWNARLDDDLLNQYTDSRAIRYQASIFNAAGRVFAPRYRQAHLHSFFVKGNSEEASAKQALEVAYSDVLAAFDYYLQHWNQGRPIILAAHSQGALHTLHLLKDRFDGQPLAKQLVAAYVVGWPVPEKALANIPPCTAPDQTGCVCTWRTYERHWVLRKEKKYNEKCTIIVTNPLNWSNQPDKYVPRTENKGAVITDIHKIIPACCDAEVHSGVLMCNKPHFPGSFLYLAHNYHPGDLNLFYVNVRENAQKRVANFLKK